MLDVSIKKKETRVEVCLLISLFCELFWFRCHFTSFRVHALTCWFGRFARNCSTIFVLPRVKQGRKKKYFPQQARINQSLCSPFMVRYYRVSSNFAIALFSIFNTVYVQNNLDIEYSLFHFHNVDTWISPWGFCRMVNWQFAHSSSLNTRNKNYATLHKANNCSRYQAAVTVSHASSDANR